MGVAGSISPPGGAPKPDPERVATLRYTLVDEPETCAAFGEAPRATLASLNDRALAETRDGDLGECNLLLDHVRDRVAGLDPARLQPRGGLAGLFDSRNKRLKAFRTAYASAASAVTQSAADIADRAGALARKDTALDTLWTETRDAIAELDAHIAAARGWLANEAPVIEPAEPVSEAEPEPVVVIDEPVAASDQAEEVHQPVDAEGGPAETSTEGAVDEPAMVTEGVASEHDAAPEASPSTTAVPETGETPATVALVEPAEPVESTEVVAEAASNPDPTSELQIEPESDLDLTPEAEPEPASEPEQEPASETATVATLPHPLETRLAALEAVRATAIGRLPLIRAAQNADCRIPVALKQVCDGVEAWRADWQDALGLAGKRPKKVTPDRTRLMDAASALTDRLDAVGRELSAAQGRRAELDARAEPLQTTPALAA